MKKTGKVINCAACGKEKYYAAWALRNGYKYCSHACAAKLRFIGNRNPRWNGGLVKINCLICLKEFYRKPYDLKRKFCSFTCTGIYRSKHPTKPKTGIYKNCAICKKEIYISKSTMERKKYCSIECRGIAIGIYNKLINKVPPQTKITSIIKNCLECNQEFKARESLLKKGFAKYCSRKCALKNNKTIFIKQNKLTLFKLDKGLYRNIHKRIERLLGKPMICEICNKDGLSGKSIHWANISGNYLLEKEDWLRLCAKCHITYDNNQHLF